MIYVLDKESPKPIYLQLYERLLEDIVNGVYPFGSRLPSKRLLSDEIGISLITAEHAYELLCDEGYAEARERSGFYVIYREFEAMHTAENNVKPHRIIHRRLTDTAANIDFPFSVYAKTMRRVLSAYGEDILIKSPGNGCPELREAIADYLARSRGISVTPNQIVIGSGAEYLYGLVVQMLGRERIYGIEDPSYEKIELVYGGYGAKCDFLKLGEDGIESSELSHTAATVLHITPYRSYPSGVTASASKRLEYIEWAKERGGILIEDDFESEFSTLKKPEETVFSIAPDGYALYINSFSKTIAPSIRIGYLVLPPSLVSLFTERAGFYSCTVPTFDQYVLAEFISSGDFERHINRIRHKKRQELAEKSADYDSSDHSCQLI